MDVLVKKLLKVMGFLLIDFICRYLNFLLFELVKDLEDLI